MNRITAAFIYWLLALLCSGFSGETRAQDAQNCAGLAGYQFSRVEDAPTFVVSASVLPANVDRPAICEVRGYVAPQVQIILQLPMEKWNGKLLVRGCGGFCGQYEGYISQPTVTTPASRLRSNEEALRRGYAVTASNMGHYSTSRDAIWAYNNLQAEIDFGHRATHVNTLAAKAIVDRFYRRPAAKTYFNGCSTGGRQGFVAAQRYPNDFDGIIAGAPPLYYDTIAFQVYWEAVANIDERGSQILTPRDVRFLHDSVVKACDAIDGFKDGVIGNPMACGFDLASLSCKGGGPTSQCLTEKQVDAARKIYAGPVDSRGRPIHMGGGGFTLGSELNWIGQSVVGEREDQPATFLTWMEDMFRYMVFSQDPGPTWSRADLNWDTDPARARAHMASIYNATNPDLSDFQRSGGKLIAYQGWIDQQVIPKTPIKYYEMAAKTMGGQQRTQEFMRLYMLPGVGHCSGGPGADTIDYLTYLENWVEKGEPPDSLLATHYDNETGRPAFTRPVFPYPDVARYSGRGDHNDAGNWKRQKGTLGQPANQ